MGGPKLNARFAGRTISFAQCPLMDAFSIAGEFPPMDNSSASTPQDLHSCKISSEGAGRKELDRANGKVDNSFMEQAILSMRNNQY